LTGKVARPASAVLDLDDPGAAGAAGLVVGAVGRAVGAGLLAVGVAGRAVGVDGAVVLVTDGDGACVVTAGVVLAVPFPQPTTLATMTRMTNPTQRAAGTPGGSARKRCHPPVLWLTSLTGGPRSHASPLPSVAMSLSAEAGAVALPLDMACGLEDAELSAAAHARHNSQDPLRRPVFAAWAIPLHHYWWPTVGLHRASQLCATVLTFPYLNHRYRLDLR
jgi:hypothetical protein